MISRLRQTIRGKLTLAFAATALLLLPPVISAVAHINRLLDSTRELVELSIQQQKEPSPKKALALRAQVLATRSRVILAGDQAYRDVVTLASLSLIVLVALTVALPQRILRPLRRLIALSRQAEGGNLNVAPALITSDEIGELAAGLNRVMRDLRSFDRLKAAKIVSLASQRDALLELLERPAVVLDRQGRVAGVSRAFCSRFSFRREELIDQPLLGRPGWDSSALAEALTRSLTAGSLQLPLELGGQRYRAEVITPRQLEAESGYSLLLLGPGA